MRIHKALSDNSIASRRAAEKMIAEGRVTVNGHPAFLGQDIDPATDVIHIDKERVFLSKRVQKIYLALYKPRGYVTTLADEMDRRCVADLVKEVPARVYPVGRLDKDSEGILIMTNDGEFANWIMHPSHHIPKTYRVTVRSGASEEQLIALSTGVTLDDGHVTAPAQVSVESTESTRTVLRITIHEGRNRQIRRMCDAVGLVVARLKRVSVGPVKLGMLKPGEHRELTAVELKAIRNAVTIVEPQNQSQKAKSRNEQPRAQKRRAPDDKKRIAKPNYSKRG